MPVREMPAGETQRILFRLCAELRELDAGLGQLCERLPRPVEGFNAEAELRGLLECVRTDLLEDAIQSLQTAAKRSEAEWRQAYDQRARLLVRPDEPSCAVAVRAGERR